MLIQNEIFFLQFAEQLEARFLFFFILVYKIVKKED